MTDSQQRPPLSEVCPGGCYLLFNSVINWEATEKIVAACQSAIWNGYKEVTLCLNSTGGGVDLAFYLYHVLKALPLRIVTHNVGAVKSAANVLFMAGATRRAAPGTTFFFHQTWFQSAEPLSASVVRKRLESIENDDDRMILLISILSGQTTDDVRAWHSNDRTIHETEAHEQGIVHEVCSLTIPANAHIERIVVQ